MITKSFLFANRKAPNGSVYALESLEVMLISAAFDQDISLAFLDDGVYQVTKNKDTSGIFQKDFSKTYKALGDYDINKIYVEKESLKERGLNKEDLMDLVWEDEDNDWKEESSIILVNRESMSDLMKKQDVILTF